MASLSLARRSAAWRNFLRSVHSLFLNESDGNFFSISDEAHFPYCPMTLMLSFFWIMSAILCVDAVPVKIGRSSGTAGNPRVRQVPAILNPANPAYFMNSLLLFFM